MGEVKKGTHTLTIAEKKFQGGDQMTKLVKVSEPQTGRELLENFWREL